MEDSNVLAVMGEFEGIDLGHEKRNRRLKRVVAALGAKPDASFPEAMGSDAELEGLYGFLNNPNVSAGKLLAPHCAETVERVRSKPQPVVVASHDTTGLEFAGDGRKGLGPMLRSERGFYAHFSLAVNPDERHEPLGILSFIPIIRKEKAARAREGRKTALAVQSDPEKEYLRWTKGIDEVERQLAGVKRVIHVADRESDSYEIISGMVANERGFVLRLRYDRKIIAGDEVIKL